MRTGECTNIKIKYTEIHTLNTHIQHTHIYGCKHIYIYIYIYIYRERERERRTI